LILHAGAVQLGDLDLVAAGDVYGVKTRSADIGIKSRGVKIVDGPAGDKAGATTGVEFVENRVELRTSR